MGEIGKCAQCFRVLLIIINIIFMLIGLALLGVGIYLAVVGNNLSFLTTGSVYTGGAALLIICGVVTVVITALGIVAGIGLWRPLLVIYVIVLVIIVILEIVAGILGFVYRGEVVRGIEGRFNNTISQFRASEDDPLRDPGVNDAVAVVQRAFDCCGSTSPQSWIDLNLDAVEQSEMRPPFCDLCNSTTDPMTCSSYWYRDNTTMQIVTFEALSTGCVDGTRGALEIAAYTAGGIGIAFGIIEIFGVLISIGLICAVTKSKENTMV